LHCSGGVAVAEIELCADELVVGGGVALWSAASAASDRMREH